MTLSRLMILIPLLALGCHAPQTNFLTPHSADTNLFSPEGREVVVRFRAEYRVKDTGTSFTTPRISRLESSLIPETTKFLFGPLTHSEKAGIQRGEKIKVDASRIREVGSELVIPYSYEGTWLVHPNLMGSGRRVQLPLPYNAQSLLTKNWKACSDSDPNHQTPSSFWYYWDPSRMGCDHVLGTHYQNVTLDFGDETPQTQQTYPEYSRLLRPGNGQTQSMQVTIGFGYVEDENVADPFTDGDFGMSEFRSFHEFMEERAPRATQTPITLRDYGYAGNSRIGTRFSWTNQGVRFEIKVVAASGIDQMELFAKSVAQDQDGAFAWFGHSRVGSGFDANRFADMLKFNPEKYRLTENYQLIYWGGCNSYSYYSLPFFDLKSALNPTKDPKGTKNLDIIANGLASYFHYNARSAEIFVEALINFRKKTSFQDLATSLEGYADDNGSNSLVVILGDEDNP